MESKIEKTVVKGIPQEILEYIHKGAKFYEAKNSQDYLTKLRASIINYSASIINAWLNNN